MNKKLITIFLSFILLITSLTGCSKKVDESKKGKTLNIYCWHDEFKGYCEQYYFGTKPIADPDNSVATKGKNTGDEVYYENAKGLPEGVTINWIINPNDDGVYQDKLDAALFNQSKASYDDKVDMFLAEADYIYKYIDTDYTADITKMGVTDFSNTYEYTVKACTSANGEIKGVSFQCCPSAVIYRRSIAKDVLGTDDPDEVQKFMNDWDGFNNVAALAKEKGYYMTSSFAATYRAYSGSKSQPWVDSNKNLQFDQSVTDWIEQTDLFVENGYTLTAGIWDAESMAQMLGSGKTMCYLGPAWYFNFSMGNAQDPEKGCFGDWAVCKGPQAHFWGGTWLVAASGSDNEELVADIMNTFINDKDVCSHLVTDANQFSNNKAVNESFANDPNFGIDFLGGQNATAIFCELADDVRFENQTIYDQLCTEGIQNRLQEYWKGQVTKEDALNNFKIYIKEKYPSLITP